jgi:hypothetical protein
MWQIVRNLTFADAAGCRVLICDRDAKWSEAVRARLQELERLRQRQPMDPAPLLLAHVGMGNTEAAFAVMDEAYSAHSTALPSLRVNPIYDPIRDDPRFDRLMLRIGLRP